MKYFTTTANDQCFGHKMEIDRLKREIRHLNYELERERRKDQNNNAEYILIVMHGLLVGTIIYYYLLAPLNP